MSKRLDMLNNLAEKLPGMNDQIRAQRQAAIGTGIQGAIQGAVAGNQPVQQTAGQIGVAAQKAAGQEALQATQEQQQQLAGVGQEMVRTKSAEFQNRMGRMKLRHQQNLGAKVEHLGKLGADLKEQLFNKQMKFAEDEQGRKFSNTTQLIDWSMVSAKNIEEHRDRLQKIEQLSKKKIAMLEAAHNRLVQGLQHSFAAGQQALDQKHKERLSYIATRLRKEIEKEKRKASNRMMAAKGVGMAVGMAVGYGLAPATGGLSAAAMPMLIGGQVGGSLGQAGEGAGMFDFIG